MLKKILQENFTIIDNRIAQCKNLSFEARGLYFYMQSLPDDWEFSEWRLAQNAGIGLDKTKRILKELFELGLLTREFTHNERGSRKSIYTLFDFETMATNDNPTSFNPTSENQMKDNPMNNKEIYITKKDTKEKKIFKKEALQKKATEPSELVGKSKTESSPICQKAFFEFSDFQDQDNITQADLDYLNTFSDSLTQEQEKYKRELGLFIMHRKTHRKHSNLSELALRQLLTKLKSFSSLKSIKEALIESVINGWAGVFEPKQIKKRFEYNTYNQYDTGDNSVYLRHALGLDKKDKS